MLICLKMARTDIVGFKMVYKLAFETIIHGHQATWNPEIGKQLVYHEDTRKEAKEYDRNAVGAFKTSKQCCRTLSLWNYLNSLIIF